MFKLGNPFSRLEALVPGKAGKIYRRHQLLFLVVLLMTLVASFFTTANTWAAGETSNLNNRYLNTQNTQNTPFPERVFRGDTRSPGNIFSNGFTARGNSYDLERYVQGNRDDTRYIGTTGTVTVAEGFAYQRGAAVTPLTPIANQPGCSTRTEDFYTSIPGIGRFLLGVCQRIGNSQVVTARTYVYEIDPAYAQNALYVPDRIRYNTALYNLFRSQDEWAYVERIPTQAIVGVHLYQLTAPMLADGTYDRSNIQYTNLHDFVTNPNYGGITRRNPNYNPANDTASGWSYTTDPNLPTASCPANPNVYQHCG